MTKLVVRVTAEDYVEDYLDGKSIGKVIELLQDWKDAHGEDAKFDVDYDERNHRIRLTKKREETDAEYNKRVEQDTLIRSRREVVEKAELKRLQEKYGA